MPPEVGGAVIQVDVQNTVQSRFPKGLSSSAANGTPTLQQTRKTDDSDVLLKLSITAELEIFESISRYENDYGLDLSKLWRTIRDLDNCPNLCILARYLSLSLQHQKPRSACFQRLVLCAVKTKRPWIRILFKISSQFEGSKNQGSSTTN